jgi:hypothetical protein
VGELVSMFTAAYEIKLKPLCVIAITLSLNRNLWSISKVGVTVKVKVASSSSSTSLNQTSALDLLDSLSPNTDSGTDSI